MRVRDAMIAGLAALLCGAADARATVGPGVTMDTEGGGGCTSNFVFRDATDVYLGYAAHCAEDANAAGNDCSPASLPLDTPVTIEGAAEPGRLAYSSWHTMHDVGETDEDVCASNDFAVVRIDPADHGAVDPSVPVWGGPSGLRRAPVQDGETMVSYGRSSLRGDAEPLKPREGYVASTDRGGWRHTTWFFTMAVWGDSGSAALDGAGGAAGVVVTIEPITPGANGVTDLARALDYMRGHGGPQAYLVNGTAPFTGASVPEQVESPPSEPDSPPPPPAERQPDPQPVQPPAPPAAPAAPAAAAAPPAAKPKAKPRPKKAKRKRKRGRRCRARGVNRRSIRGRNAPKCSRGRGHARRRR